MKNETKHTPGMVRLYEAAKSAADWLLECTRGTDQHERGIALNEAIIYAEYHWQDTALLAERDALKARVERLEQALRGIMPFIGPLGTGPSPKAGAYQQARAALKGQLRK